MTTKTSRRPDPRYRVNSIGDPVIDNRTVREEPAPSSPARTAYHAERVARRAAARAAKAAPIHAVANAARKAGQ